MAKQSFKAIDYLGINALLQLQEQGINVSKQLQAKNRPDLIKIVAPVTKPQEVTKKERQHKYNVSPEHQRTVDGVVFASKTESQHYILLRDKNIQFTRQDKFTLLEGFRDREGKWHRPIEYVSDFILRHPDGREFVVDTKGMKTTEFRMKEKLFIHRYQRPIYCIQKVNDLFRFLIDKGFIGKL